MRVVLPIYTYDLGGWSKVHIYYNLYYAVNLVVNSWTLYQHDVSSCFKKHDVSSKKKKIYIYIYIYQHDDRYSHSYIVLVSFRVMWGINLGWTSL